MSAQTVDGHFLILYINVDSYFITESLLHLLDPPSGIPWRTSTCLSPLMKHLGS